MKPIVIKKGNQRLSYDPLSKHAEIFITSECAIKQSVFQYFIDVLPLAESLDIQIQDTEPKQASEEYLHFIALRKQLETHFQQTLEARQNPKKQLHCSPKLALKISYQLTNFSTLSIKNAAGFILAAQQSATNVQETKIQIIYNYPLSSFPGAFQAISSYLRVLSSSITEFILRINSYISNEKLLSLCDLIQSLKSAKKIIFRSQSTLNIYTEADLEKFIYSFKGALKSSAEHFEFDLSESDYKKGAISPIMRLLSEIIAQAGNQLTTVIVNMNKVGWTFERENLIKSDFIYGLALRMPSWPKSIKNLTVNLDRAFSFNDQIDSEDISQLLQGIKEVVGNLETLELNLCGIGYAQKHLNFSFTSELVTLLNKGINLRELNLRVSGHLSMSIGDWNRFLSSITNLNSLKKLVLDIERWKNYSLIQLTLEEQTKLLNIFLENLFKNHNKSLQVLHLNIDDWGYQTESLNDYTKQLMKFQNILDFQLLWFKSSKIPELKPLDLLQDMAHQRSLNILKLAAAKKIKINIPIKAQLEYQENEAERLTKHIEYYKMIQYPSYDQNTQFIHFFQQQQ